MLAGLLSCGLRRSEVAAQTLKHIQHRPVLFDEVHNAPTVVPLSRV
jgi:integrase